MARIHELAENIRKLLVRSRNRIPGGPIPQPPAPVVVKQNAFIDIMEPLLIGSGQTQNVAFQYITGEPAATAFGMQWWASESDARRGLPPLVYPAEMPTQSFLPEVPQPNTGALQEGIVAITVPRILIAEEDFFGQIIIYQV